MINSKLLLLYGPSGVGKTSIMRRLVDYDDRFVFVVPFTTRALRDGEIDKAHVSVDRMLEMEMKNCFVYVNEVYGVKYATPKEPIDSALAQGLFPVLDWPIQKSWLMKMAFPGKVFGVYVAPPSAEVLERRLALRRERNPERISEGLLELGSLDRGDFEGLYDHLVISREDELEGVALEVCRNYFLACKKIFAS